ncbi:MAG TPA: CDP-alcohol phosphatidyltransferase family protein [Candidatus Aminicenantes bacterium]|nr:CDP-alcohol phosphatidyltransferase family protein [Candidatus Aminicenantes bacterium]
MKKSDSFYQSQLKKGRTNFWAHYLNFETWISRPLASLLVRLVYPTAVTPNQLTVFALLVSLASAVLFARGRPISSLLAAVFCQLSLILDCADGMLARSRNACSRFGSYLDLFLDRIADFCVLLGVVIGYFRAGAGNKDRLILGLFIIALYLLQVILYYISNSYTGAENGDSGEARAVVIMYITVMGALNRLDLIVYGMAAEVAVNLVFRIGKFLLMGRKSGKGDSYPMAWRLKP